jgi:hypothetical protein
MNGSIIMPLAYISHKKKIIHETHLMCSLLFIFCRLIRQYCNDYKDTDTHKKMLRDIKE